MLTQYCMGCEGSSMGYTLQALEGIVLSGVVLVAVLGLVGVAVWLFAR